MLCYNQDVVEVFPYTVVHGKWGYKSDKENNKKNKYWHYI